jgi:predicted  nucleic acid-binding Zn-ribbon protein
MPPRARHRAPARLLALALGVGLVLAAIALPAGAEPTGNGPDRTDTPDHADTFDPEAYRALALEVSRNGIRLTELAKEIDEATARIATLDGEIAKTKQQLDATRAEIERIRDIVRERAAFIYTHARSPRVLLDIPRVEDISVGTQYAQSATVADASDIADLTRTANSIEAKLKDEQSARERQVEERDELQRSRDELQVANERKQKLLDEAGTITVMGDSELTGEQIAAWFEARGVRYRLTGGTTIRELADLFVGEGKAEHVRGDIAFAQSVLETGSFGNAWDNNYGGIGACDSCKGEIGFLTPQDGVRGQIQMLRNYADPLSRAANLASPPSPQIYGHDPVAAAAAYDSFFAKGRVPTWNLMGNGNWATSTEYAPKVLGIYFEMVAFAARNGDHTT